MILSLVLAGVLVDGSGKGTATVPAAVETESGPVTPAPAELAAFYNRKRVPSFARQLHLSCGVCHVGFPELTWFGRMFKLNGYTLSGLEKIVDRIDSTSRRTLDLAPIPAMSVSALVSSTSVNKAFPGTSATRTEFPQQLSVFWAGQVSTDIGALLQLTYSDVGGKVGMDVSDLPAGRVRTAESLQRLRPRRASGAVLRPYTVHRARQLDLRRPVAAQRLAARTARGARGELAQQRSRQRDARRVVGRVHARRVFHRVGLQYERYDTFNGSATSYDVPVGGRRASDNNTLYLYFWLAF